MSSILSADTDVHLTVKHAWCSVLPYDIWHHSGYCTDPDTFITHCTVQNSRKLRNSKLNLIKWSAIKYS